MHGCRRHAEGEDEFDNGGEEFGVRDNLVSRSRRKRARSIKKNGMVISEAEGEDGGHMYIGEWSVDATECEGRRGNTKTALEHMSMKESTM